MEEDGYLVIPSWIDAKDLSQRVASYKDKTEWIFNGPGRNDRKRRQVALPMALVADLQKKIGSLSFVTDHHTVHDFVLLRSLPGCMRQAAHTDYIPDVSLLQCPPDQLPYLALIAIQDKTSLIVWPGSHKVIRGRGRTVAPIEPHKVELKAGDLLVFRPDLVHAGAEVSTENLRIHCYIDSDSVYRMKNRTYILQVHGEELMKEKILEPV